METINIIELIGAIILAYLVLFLTMWIFRRRKKEDRPKK
jgi:hypothetical protein